MALLFADGFEHYGLGSTTSRSNMLAGEYAFIGTSNTCCSNAQKRTGNQSFLCSVSNVCLIKTIPSTHNEVGVAFGSYMEFLPPFDSARIEYRFEDQAGNRIITAAVTPTGALAIWRGVAASGTLLGSSADNVLTASAWHHIEVRILRDSIVGEVEVRINGVVEAYFTDLNLGGSDTRLVTFYKNSSSAPNFYIDDLILWDTLGSTNNSFFGPARVNTVWLAGDTAKADWASNGGPGYGAIDDLVPDADTTYVSAAAVGATSEYTIAALPSEVDAIAGVYVASMGKLAAAGIGDLKTSIVSGAAVLAGPVYPLTTAYTYWGSVFERNPDGNVPWNKATFEAAKIRIEKVG